MGLFTDLKVRFPYLITKTDLLTDVYSKKKNTNVINCEEAGVLGTTVGIIGMFQANEVMKMILETGDILSGKLLLYNTLNNTQNIINFKRDDSIKVDRDFYNSEHSTDQIININAQEALSNNSKLLDVREYGEIPEIDSEKNNKNAIVTIGIKSSYSFKRPILLYFLPAWNKKYDCNSFFKIEWV